MMKPSVLSLCFLLIFSAHADCIWCTSLNGINLLEKETQDSIGAIIQAAIANNPCLEKCNLNPHCVDGSNPSWAASQIGADLAEQILSEVIQEYEYKPAEVGVVDSGFDITQKANFDTPISVEKGCNNAGDPNEDPVGHGTAVTGTIASSQTGVTGSVNITVYRTSNNDTGSADKGQLAIAIRNACQTADVVNVSMGNDDDERGQTKLEEQSWYQVAKSNGCLVIQAAGNDGVKAHQGMSYQLNDPYLNVMATSKFARESHFSSQGLISAPGEDIFALISSQSKRAGKLAENLCRSTTGDRIGAMSGTSFAAPLVTGVAGQVITLLKSKGTLPTDPIQKVTLIKNILQASARYPLDGGRGGQINAAFAVLMAKGISKENQLATEDELIEIGKQQASSICTTPDNNCTQIPDCEKRKACINDLRLKEKICEVPYGTPLLGQTITAEEWEQNTAAYRARLELLLDGLSCVRENELSLSLMRKTMAEGFQGKETRIEQTWLQNLGGQDDFNAATAIDILRTAQEIDYPDFVTAEKLITILDEDIFGAGDFQREFFSDINLGRGDSLAKRFFDVFSMMNEDEQVKVIDRIQTQRGNPLHLSSTDAALLYHLASGTVPIKQKCKALVDKKITELAGLWAKGRLDIETPTTLYNRNSSDDYYKILDLLFEKIPNRDSFLERQIAAPINNSNATWFNFALKAEKFVSPEAKNKALTQILTQGVGENSTLSGLTEMVLAQSVENAFENMGAGAETSQVEQFLLKNDHAIATLPHCYGQDSIYTNKLSEDFLLRYVDDLIDDAIQRLENETDDSRKIALNSLTTLLSANCYIERDKIYEHKKDKIRALIKTLIKFKIEATEYISPCANFSTNLINNLLSWGDEETFREFIKEEFYDLYQAIQENPSKYVEFKWMTKFYEE